MGKPNWAKTVEGVIDHFLSRCEPMENGCIEWRGNLAGGSSVLGRYGQLGSNGKTHYAHRFAYELFVGPIPEGLQIDHLCRNRVCVNTAHLEVVTQRENLVRGNTIIADQLTRTHCPRGHAYSGDNLTVGKKGNRECRECNMRRCSEYGTRSYAVKHGYTKGPYKKRVRT